MYLWHARWYTRCLSIPKSTRLTALLGLLVASCSTLLGSLWLGWSDPTQPLTATAWSYLLLDTWPRAPYTGYVMQPNSAAHTWGPTAPVLSVLCSKC
jgi:hypothetical protein